MLVLFKLSSKKVQKHKTKQSGLGYVECNQLPTYLGGSDDASAGVDVEGTVIIIVIGGDEGVGDGGVVALVSVSCPYLQPHS